MSDGKELNVLPNDSLIEFLIAQSDRPKDSEGQSKIVMRMTKGRITK